MKLEWRMCNRVFGQLCLFHANSHMRLCEIEVGIDGLFALTMSGEDSRFFPTLAEAKQFAETSVRTQLTELAKAVIE